MSQIGVSDFKYAVLSKDDKEGVSYGEWNAIPGLVSVDIKSSGSVSTNYADNGPFETASNLGDGVEYDVTGINIISKVYENAEVAISLANVYKDHDESSEVLGKLEKGSLITIQKYDNGWSTVTNYTLSGWMKTENIKLPETSNSMTLTTSGDSRTGTVKVSDSLNMRESASTTAKIIKSLTNGTTVTILDSSNGWYKIKVGDTTGWVKSDYITQN